MFFLLVVTSIVSFFFLRLWLQKRKLPPGPLPLPFIGNVHQLGYKMFISKKNFVEAIRDWAEEYGPVHTFWFGPLATVNICDYPTAVDAMVKKGSSFADRTIPYLLGLTRKNNDNETPSFKDLIELDHCAMFPGKFSDVVHVDGHY